MKATFKVRGIEAEVDLNAADTLRLVSEALVTRVNNRLLSRPWNTEEDVDAAIAFVKACFHWSNPKEEQR